MPKFEDFFNINPGIIFGIYTGSHIRLIAKLKAYGFVGLVIKWIEAFLKATGLLGWNCFRMGWDPKPGNLRFGNRIALFVLFINDLPSKPVNVSKIPDDTKIATPHSLALPVTA